MTVFNCTMCGACCANLGADQSVLLLKEDLDLLAEREQKPISEIIASYCEYNGELSERACAAILQLKSANGRCVFLDPMNRCGIHDHKPTQCRIGPDRFLPEAMRVDYECMVGIEVSKDDDLTEQFFSRLMENVYAERSSY